MSGLCVTHGTCEHGMNNCGRDICLPCEDRINEASARIAEEDGPCRFGPPLEIGSAAWIERRRRLWEAKARHIMTDLIRYEDEHPDDAPCFAATLEAARRSVPRA